MFSGSKNSNVQDNKVDTVIGEATIFRGNIVASGIVKIDGTYNGDIYTDSDVIIGEFAKVTGNIDANNITISGCIEGNLKCKGTLKVLSTANLKGNVELRGLAVSKGAIVNGKCTMENKGANNSLILLENKKAL